MLLDLLTVAVLAWFGSRLVLATRTALRGDARDRSLELVRGLRVHHFLLGVVALALVLAVAIALVQLPLLSFGWWTAIGGTGNPVVGSTERTQGTPLATILPALFLVVLVPALPLLVEREERMFRLGSEHRSVVSRARWALLFGCVHAIVGIPIGAALALSVGGAYLTWAYLRGWRRGGQEAGLLESSRSHLAYNLLIVALIAVALATGQT